MLPNAVSGPESISSIFRQIQARLGNELMYPFPTIETCTFILSAYIYIYITSRNWTGGINDFSHQQLRLAYCLADHLRLPLYFLIIESACKEVKTKV
jgi:hypothetical protein